MSYRDALAMSYEADHERDNGRPSKLAYETTDRVLGALSSAGYVVVEKELIMAAISICERAQDMGDVYEIPLDDVERLKARMSLWFTAFPDA